MKAYGIVFDSHRPFHHRRATAVMMNCFADQRLSGLHIIGDYLDFYYINGHGPKHPSMRGHLQDEIESGNAGLDEIDKTFGNRIEKHFWEGNHEYRLERFLWNKAPELFGFLDVKHLLKIDQRVNWKWHKYGPFQKGRIGNSKLYIRHEPPTGQITTYAQKAGVSLVFGHVHRRLEAGHVSLDGRETVAFCAGWMGDIRNEQVFGYVKGWHTWQLGFAIVWVDPKTGWFTYQMVPIIDNKAYVNGKTYRG